MKLRKLSSIALWSFAAACVPIVNPTIEPDAREPDAGPDAGSDAGPDAVPGAQPTAACLASPAACLYPTTTLAFDVIVAELADPDRLGGPRSIPIAIRWSPDAPRPMPVVIWSHGGADGHTDPTTSLDRWATAGARAGYLSIAIAHVPRDPDQRAALCTAFGMDATACAAFKPLTYDRPLDVRAVIDEVIAMTSRPAWAGRIDSTRIAVGGHSGGAGATLMVAGAPRDLGGQSTTLADARPIAFIAMSPQAPGTDGFTSAGYSEVSRPTLIGTGRGDDNASNPANGRASVFELIQPGDKARVFVEDAAAVHSLFALELDGCIAAGATLARCTDLRDWVHAAAFAFLDAHLRDAAEAQAWLASSNLAAASAGTAEWSVR